MKSNQLQFINMHFPIHQAEIIEVIDESTCLVKVKEVGTLLATRSMKMKRAVPVLAVGEVVAVQFSPYDKTRCSSGIGTASCTLTVIEKVAPMC